MRTRKTARRATTAAAAVLAALLSPVAGGPTPAAAHTGFTSITDDANADRSASNINGTTVKVRVLRPDSGKPSAGWPLVVYMAGGYKNRCANANETSTRTSWYTRKQMAEHGFAVLSFNARGMPGVTNAGLNPSGTSGCTALDDAKDAIDDSGWDMGGPVDKQDIDDLIEWAVASYTWSGCSSSCIDGNHVGLFGVDEDSRKALLMGVPSPPNSQYNTRVDGIVAVGYGELAVRNLKDVSNDGAGTPAWRPIDHGYGMFLPDFDAGQWSHADPSVLTNHAELLRPEYLNLSVASSVTTWFDDRTIVDDTASVDKAEEIETPVFLANAFLDGQAGTTTATLAYNKLGATNKYLYLGACGSTYSHLPSADSGPCLTTNRANLRDKVHEFLDYHVKGDGSALSAKVYWAVPPATSPLSTDSWSVASDTIASWPPATPASGTYTQPYCLGGTGVWLPGTCSTVSQNTSERTISNVLEEPGIAFCSGTTYGSTEVVGYTSDSDPTVDYKMIGFEADVSIRSDDTTRLQVYADLFTVDGSNNETRVWQGNAQVVPVKRNGTASTIYRFKFKPAGAAWTLKATHLVRVKIAAAYKKAFTPELLPATYRIYHTDTNPTHFTITFDL